MLLLHMCHQLHRVGEGLAAVRAPLVATAIPAARRRLLPNAAAAPAPRMCGLRMLNQLLHSGEPRATLLAALRPVAAGRCGAGGQVNHICCLTAALLLLLPVLLKLRLDAAAGLRRCSSWSTSCSGPAGLLPRRCAGLLSRRCASLRPRRTAARCCTAAAATAAAAKQAAKAAEAQPVLCCCCCRRSLAWALVVRGEAVPQAYLFGREAEVGRCKGVFGLGPQSTAQPLACMRD